MKYLVRACVLAFVGYIVGVVLTIAVRGGSPTDEVVVVFAFILALLGWLAGIGGIEAFGRQWIGKAPQVSTDHSWRRYFQFSVDHKVIGIQYGVTLLAVLLLGGLTAMVMRIELASPGMSILDLDEYNKLMSMHGILMIAVAVAGIIGSFGNYIIPIQIGAADMAFPRLNALSFWLVPPVAFALLSAPLLGSFNAGWTAYAPLSVVNDSGQILFNLAIIAFGLSSILGGLNIIVTVVMMRAPGMSWGRLPIFTWAGFATALLSFSVTQFFAGAMVLVTMDRVAGTDFFGPDVGTALLYEHIFWFYSHPAVYIMVLPGLGVIMELTTTFGRRLAAHDRWALVCCLGAPHVHLRHGGLPSRSVHDHDRSNLDSDGCHLPVNNRHPVAGQTLVPYTSRTRIRMADQLPHRRDNRNIPC